jgi:hypothetical protein
MNKTILSTSEVKPHTPGFNNSSNNYQRRLYHVLPTNSTPKKFIDSMSEAMSEAIFVKEKTNDKPIVIPTITFEEIKVSDYAEYSSLVETEDNKDEIESLFYELSKVYASAPDTSGISSMSNIY